jgi:hypothetical protein
MGTDHLMIVQRRYDPRARCRARGDVDCFNSDAGEAHEVNDIGPQSANE